MDKNLYLHDYEISDIKIQYTEAKIQIKLYPPNSFEHYTKIVIIKDFVKLEFIREEAWGMGKYVFFAEVSYDEKKKMYEIFLQLNSGDTLTVTSKSQPIIDVEA